MIISNAIVWKLTAGDELIIYNQSVLLNFRSPAIFRGRTWPSSPQRYIRKSGVASLFSCSWGRLLSTAIEVQLCVVPPLSAHQVHQYSIFDIPLPCAFYQTGWRCSLFIKWREKGSIIYHSTSQIAPALRAYRLVQSGRHFAFS